MKFKNYGKLKINEDMKATLVLLVLNLKVLHAAYIYDDDEPSPKSTNTKLIDELEFEPIVSKEADRVVQLIKKLSCDDFTKYSLNCTLQSALLYNSSKKSPPMPGKVFEWCRAIRYLTNCAIDWNSECNELTDKRFNEESIKGHMHVVNNVCDDEYFLSRYDDVPNCIDKSGGYWETCYNVFINRVDELKNASQHWTHYETHFKLCCARTQFRRCTLNVLFDNQYSKCSRDNALTLQKFSVIVSEGAVFQDCEHNMMYENCPGGDPRPSGTVLANLMNAEVVNLNANNHHVSNKSTTNNPLPHLILFLMNLLLYCF